MPDRGLLILAVFTLAAVITSWFAIDQRYQEAPLNKQEGGLVFPALRSQLGKVAEIEVARASGQFSLTRRENGWANMGVGGYPALGARVQNVINAVAGLKYIQPKTRRSQLHQKLSVEDVTDQAKSTRLTFKNAAGAVLADIIVGKPKENVASLQRPEVYVRLPGSERAWLAEGLLDARYDAIAWSDPMVIDIDARSLRAMRVRDASGAIVALHREQSQDVKMTLKNLPVGKQIEHQYQIDYMAGLLQNVRFEDAKKISEADLEINPAFEVEVQSKDRLVVTLIVSEQMDDGSVWAQIDAHAINDGPVSESTSMEVTRIKTNFEGWSVKLSRKVTDRLKIRLEDIIKNSKTRSKPELKQ